MSSIVSQQYQFVIGVDTHAATHTGVPLVPRCPDFLDSHATVMMRLFSNNYRGEPAELAVSALPVVPDLEVLEDRVGEFDPGVPLLRSRGVLLAGGTRTLRSSSCRSSRRCCPSMRGGQSPWLVG